MTDNTQSSVQTSDQPTTHLQNSSGTGVSYGATSNTEHHLDCDDLSKDYTNSDSQPVTLLQDFISNFKIHPILVVSFLIIILPCITWLIAYLLFGQQDLPGGPIFVLVVLEFGGRILGHAVTYIKLPPMVGMLGLGIAIRNIPHFDFGKYMTPEMASPIRQIALAIILIRAGLGLDLAVLLRLKSLVFRLAVFPTAFESVVVGIATYFLLGFPWSWSFLVGFVVAAVSPAVVVPRILHLRDQGYGVKKGVPTIILASASLDNVFAIVLFGTALGFVFSNKSMWERILQGPIEVLLGLAIGFIWGGICGFIFSKSEEDKLPDRSETLQKAALILGGGIISVMGCKHFFNYSGAGALGCLLLSFVASCFWRSRGVLTNKDDSLPWIFTFLWLIFEPLLFGVIGCQIDLASLEKRTVLLGLAILCIGAVVRFATTYVMVSGAKLNFKEKMFVAISWSPKATVQAAIGPIALDMARDRNNAEEIDLGQQVLTLAVLVILLTAPLGEMGVILSGPKLLSNDTTAQEDEHAVSEVP